MAFLLHIDTSLANAYCALSLSGIVVAARYNSRQQNHAAWLHTAIRQLLEEAGTTGTALHAVTVTSGPGSYTGLRVGMATAKGLCYAWNLPLITVSTLRLMAMAAAAAAPGATRIYPMIDARRMEVFMAGYDNQLQEIMVASAVILTQQLADELKRLPAVYCGDGANKLVQLGISPRMISEATYTPAHHASQTTAMFAEKIFANLAYCQPEYGKAVYTTAKQRME